MEAPAPAPSSTAISAPSDANFFTVSGVMATLCSSLARSLRTAMRRPEPIQRSGDQDYDDCSGNEGNDRSPLYHADEAGVGFFSCLDIVARRHNFLIL